MSLDQKKASIIFEQQVIEHDGNIRWHWWTDRALFNEQGSVNEYQSLGKDITEEKLARDETAKLKRQLRQAQKMEAMGALARGIAHDFNNILWSISGNTEFVLLNLSDRAIAKATLEDILKSCNRAKDLINQILTFSRKDERELKPVNIKPIIKEAIKLLRATLPATIEIREHIEKNLGLIKADPTQIYQVIVNLCTNAEHAMRENGGILEVNLKKVDIKKAITSLEFDLLPGKYLRLSVKDTGHGMSSKMVEQIFEPYFTTKKRDEGTGLGLAVVRGIVKGHVGAIIVESEPGKGTNFHVYFPAYKARKKM